MTAHESGFYHVESLYALVIRSECLDGCCEFDREVTGLVL